MPIRFRCGYCNRLLGIARRKAGTETNCPHCGYAITVPVPDDAGDDGESAANMDEIDALLSSASASATTPSPSPSIEPPHPERPAPAAPTAAPRPAPGPAAARAAPTPAAQPKPLAPGERPLFERDLDAVLGTTNANDRPTDAKPKAAPTSGMDAMSLGPDSGHIVLSSQKVTALAVVVVVLLALSFAAGFLIASR